MQVLPERGDTIHGLAVKKAASELEQGRGWLAAARTSEGKLLREQFDGRFADMVEREAVRLGVQFQVQGKWTSFVATERADHKPMDKDWEYLEDERPAQSLPQQNPFGGHKAPDFQMNTSLFKPAFGAASAVASHAQLFGSPSSTAPPAGNPFGSSTPRASGLFMGAGPATVTAGAASAGGGGLFGSSPHAPPVQASSFGVSPAGAANPFASSQPQFPQASGFFAAPGGLFGSAQQASQAPPAPLFGSSAASASASAGAGGLFGSSSQARQPISAAFGAAPGGLFGSASQQSSAAQASSFGAASQGLFGSPSQSPPVQASSFGASSAGAANPFASSQSLFPQATGFVAAPGGLFGSSSQQPLPAQATGGDLFDSDSDSDSEQIFQSVPAQLASYGALVTPATAAMPTPHDQALQDYQMGLMVLHQDNPRRLRMAPAASASAPASAGAVPQAQRTPPQPPTTPRQILSLLLTLQSFNGAFPYHSPMLSWLGIPVSVFRSAEAGLSASVSATLDGETTGADVLATALTIVYMESKLALFRDEWELVVEKARGWLEGVCEDGGAAYLEAAAKMI